MSSFQKLTTSQSTIHQNHWVERLIAIIAVVNLGLVLFNLSYVPWRDFYFQTFPSLTQYDQIKGIVPHRETQNYLNQVEKLEKQVMQTGLQSIQVDNLLQELRRLSNEMIQDNPFASANKSGTLERIKNQMRDHVGIASAHRAFEVFWSQDHLAQSGWQQEINFYNTRISPLIQSNYYRRIWINGKFVDYFWLIDLPFTILFGLEFLIRTSYISRSHPKLSWQEAMLRHWYDLFLLLPFWRWLRLIPVSIRLSQINLLNLEPVRAQIKYDFVTNFAEEISGIVGVRMIDQVQKLLQQGDIFRWLFKPESRRSYIKINNTNEVKAIASRLLHISVYQVIPKIQPDIEALLHHTIETTLNQSPVYRQLQNVPGMSHLPNQLTDKLVTDISQTAYSTLTTFLEDPVVIELSNRLIQNFGEALEVEVQKKQNSQEIQSLLLELLEEIKINYLKGIAEGGFETNLEEATQIRQIIDQTDDVL